MASDRPTPESAAPPDHVAVVSYIPLLAGEPGRLLSVDDPAFLRVLVDIEQCPTGQADAFLWLADRAGLQPVFVMADADRIADHLLDWSQGRPGEWFSLCLAEHAGRFAAALVPDLGRSAERFEAACLARGGAAPEGGGYDLLVRPLFFVSGADSSYPHVRRLVTDEFRVGLLDAAVFAGAHPPSAALSRVRTVGTVRVCRDGRPFGFDARPLLDRLFEWVVGSEAE